MDNQSIPISSAVQKKDFTTNNVCPVCKNLDPTNFNNEPLVNAHFDSLRAVYHRPLQRTIHCHSTLRVNLVAGVKKGCETCRLLDDARRGIAKNSLDLYQSHISIFILHAGDPLRFVLSNKTLSSDEMVDRTISTHYITGLLFTRINYRGNTVPGIGRARNIDFDATSSRTLDLARAWLNDCITTHPECRSNTSRKLPTRVINVGTSNSEVRLVETNGSEGRYATLSHYCGKIHPPLTENETLEDRKQGIPVEDLPKTYRDAIMVTRGLKLRYLWIESLCIIQDARDYIKEMAAMQDIFANAVINISADDSLDTIDGLSSILRAFGAGQEIAPGIYVRRNLGAVDSCGLSHTKDGHQHILRTRASVLQERMLSRRILHFSAYELAWECDTNVRCECSSHIRPASQRPMRKCIREQNSDAPTNINYNNLWSDICSTYSKLNLGRDFTTLNTIAGLAFRVGERSSKTYVAGLWKEDLPCGLLWRTAATVKRRRVDFPTWSWASSTGKVAIPKDQSPYKNQKPDDWLKIMKVVCENNYTMFFRTVHSRMMHGSGWMSHVRLEGEQPEMYFMNLFHPHTRSGDAVPKMKEVFMEFDVPGKLVDTTCYLLFVALLDAMYFLVLQHTTAFIGVGNSISCYKRIGRCGVIIDIADFEEWKALLQLRKEEIVLV